MFGKNLVLIENVEECSQLATLGIFLEEGTTWKAIALSPEAECHLKNLGVPFASIEDYTPASEMNRLGHENFARRDRLSAYLDQILEDPLRSAYGTSFKPGSCYTHFFKILLDAVSLRTLYLLNMLKMEMPCYVYYFATVEDTSYDFSFFNEESIFSRLIPLICKQLKIGFKEIRNDAFEKRTLRGNPSREDLYTRVKNRYQLAFLKNHPMDYARGLISRLRMNKNRTILMNYPLVYDTSFLVGLWRRDRRYNVIDWNIEDMISSYYLYPPKGGVKLGCEIPNFGTIGSKMWKELGYAKELKELFKFQGVDTFPVVSKRLEYFFSHIITKIAYSYFRTVECIRNHSVSLVVSPNACDYKERAVIEAARALSVPVIIYQHGGLFGYCEEPEAEKLQLENCDYYFAFGPGIFKHLIGKDIILPRIYYVGSAHLHELYNKNRGNKRTNADRINTIMYVPTELSGNQFYISNNHYPNIYYFHRQVSIIETLGKLKGYKIIIKLSPYLPRNKPILNYLNFLADKNFEVIHTPLVGVLDLADAYILDHPATAFLQCLSTGNPTFIYIDNNFIRLTREARKLLSEDKGVVFSEDMDDFLQTLLKYFGNEKPYYWKGNYNFLKHYGLGSSIDAPALFANQLVDEIFNRHLTQ